MQALCGRTEEGQQHSASNDSSDSRTISLASFTNLYVGPSWGTPTLWCLHCHIFFQCYWLQCSCKFFRIPQNFHLINAAEDFNQSNNSSQLSHAIRYASYSLTKQAYECKLSCTRSVVVNLESLLNIVSIICCKDVCTSTNMYAFFSCQLTSYFTRISLYHEP